MDTKRTFSDMFLEHVKKIVYKILNNENMLQSEWHLGKVDNVVNSTHVKCFIDGSNISVTVPKSPDVTFEVGDEIFVVFIGRNSNNKFALCKRGI